MGPMSSRIARALLLFLLVAAAACEPDAPAQASNAQPVAARVYDDPQFKEPPQRIVAANTAVAEYLMLLVPAERVAGLPEQVEQYSLFDFSGGGWQKPARFANYSAEAVLTLRPDLVIVHAWQEAEATRILKNRDVPLIVLDSARTWADIQATYERLGKLLHCEALAKKQVLVRGNTVERLKREAAKRPSLTAVLYSNDGNAGWVAGRNTTADAIFAMAGVKNAAGAIDGHQQVDFERLILLDPDVIVLQQPRGQTANATRTLLEGTKALANLRAVKDKRFVTLDERLVSSDSPTLVDAADDLSLALDDLLAGRAQNVKPQDESEAPGPR